jgi:hypothetical protein
MTEATRAYVYRVAVALFAVAVAYGVVAADDVPVLLNVLIAVLGLGTTGLAVKHTSTDKV